MGLLDSDTKLSVVEAEGNDFRFEEFFVGFDTGRRTKPRDAVVNIHCSAAYDQIEVVVIDTRDAVPVVVHSRNVLKFMPVALLIYLRSVPAIRV